MYKRKIEKMPDSFVVNGKPVFGTFEGNLKRLDIRGVSRPYGNFPLPKFFTNLRIKSELTFTFNIGDFIGFFSFFDAKIFGFSEVVFWNKKTNLKWTYHCVMGPRKRFVPHDMNHATTSTYSKRRHVKISWNRERDALTVAFSLKGDSVRPTASGNLVAIFSNDQFKDLTCVKPAPTMSKCSASYNAALSLTGYVTLTSRDGTKHEMPVIDGFSFLDVTRIYMKFKSSGQFVLGLGEYKGKLLAFRISTESQDAVNPDKYNRNVLFYDGKVTPLPSVVVTHPNGIENNWIIQDYENMVDLCFSPVSRSTNRISILILRSTRDSLYGTFEGTLMTDSEEKISFKSFPGIAERFQIRL